MPVSQFTYRDTSGAQQPAGQGTCIADGLYTGSFQSWDTSALKHCVLQTQLSPILDDIHQPLVRRKSLLGYTDKR